MLESGSHPGVSAEEGVGDGKGELEVDGAQDLLLHEDHLSSRVGVVAHVQEVAQQWRIPFLQHFIAHVSLTYYLALE